MFRNREDAGNQLAEQISELELHNPLVLGIPRGGIVVAATIAQRIDAELDVILARKLRAPWQRELAVGSVSEDGEVLLSEGAKNIPGLSSDYLEQECSFQREEIKRRRHMFRDVREQASIHDRSVIVTDDGIATGSTMIAALEAVSNRKPRELIAALPVAPANRLDAVASRCDRLICLHHPNVYYSVGQFYDDFHEISDEEVLDLLRSRLSASSR